MNKKILATGPSGVFLKPKISPIKDILVILGKVDEVEKIDQEYQKRKNEGPWGLEEIALLYKGFSKDALRSAAVAYCDDNMQSDAEQFVSEAHEHETALGLISANPQFVLDVLKEKFTLDFCHGTKLAFIDGIATGELEEKVDRFGKAQKLEEEMQKREVSKENVIVIGGAVSDLPMAEKSGMFIVSNTSDDKIKEKADFVFSPDDTLDILNKIYV